MAYSGASFLEVYMELNERVLTGHKVHVALTFEMMGWWECVWGDT